MSNQNEEQLIDQLAKLSGIEPEYYDIFGQRHIVSFETKRAILTAMGVHTTTHDQMLQEFTTVREATWRQPCEPVLVQRVGMEGTWSFRMPGKEEEYSVVRIEWSIRDETGRQELTEKAGPGLQPTDHVLLHGQHYW